MAVEISGNVWWLWLTALTAVLVGCYEIKTNNSEEYMLAYMCKLVAVSMAATIYWFISHTLCKKSHSMASYETLSMKEKKARDVSLKYGILRPTEGLEWIKLSHTQYVETELSNDGAYTVLRTVEQYNLFQFTKLC